MKNIAIYGAGGFGREVSCMLNIINQCESRWNLIGFFDDTKPIGYPCGYGKVLGGLEVLNMYDEPLDVIIAIASPVGVHKLVGKIKNPYIEFPNIIAPDVRFTDQNSLSLGKGNIFCWGCCVTCDITIGDFNSFNGFITIGHDSKIGNYNVFMPKVHISGGTVINDENYIGTGAIILQKNRIGYRTVVGANSVIIRNTKDDSTYVGNPATIVKF